MLKYIFKLTQFVSAFLIGHKKHYLNCPDEIISWIKVDQINKFAHFLPSIIITVLVTIKGFPMLSVEYSDQLAKNSLVIPLCFFIFLFLFSVVNGIIIEKVLINNNEAYKSYVKGNQ